MAKSSVIAILSMSTLALLIWVASFFVAWQWKKFMVAMGLQVDVEVGLINVDANMNCKLRYGITEATQGAANSVCDFVHARLKDSSIMHVRDFACSLESTTGNMIMLGCARLQRLWVGSVAMLVCACFGMLLLTLANIFLSVFWFCGRKNRWRVTATILFWAAAALPAAGVAMYGMYSGDITDLISSTTGGAFASYAMQPQEGNSLTVGFIMAVVDTAFMFVIALLSMLWVKAKHSRDVKGEDEEADSEEEENYGGNNGFVHHNQYGGASAPLLPQQQFAQPGQFPPHAHGQQFAAPVGQQQFAGQQQPGQNFRPYGF